MSIEEEIKKLEEEIKNTPYNKATEYHIGKLKAKLSRLREELKKKTKGKKSYGFAIKKAGDASVAIIGPPSVGKSTLLNMLTNAESRVGNYNFTTTHVIPGMMDYKDCKIQLLDLPGIIYGASNGKGRGREIISMARVVDLILIVVDVFTINEIEKIENELYKAGIRLNQNPPNIIIKKKDRGGINIEMVKGKIDIETAKAIAMEYLSNADIFIRDSINEEQLIDALIGNRVYIPSIIAVNKIDIKNVRLNKDAIYVSAKNGIGIEKLKEKIFEKLKLIRIYLKPEGGEIDKPMVLKRGAKIKDVCNNLHKDFIKNFRYAVINGPSADFPRQRVGLNHELKDGDIVTIIAR